MDNSAEDEIHKLLARLAYGNQKILKSSIAGMKTAKRNQLLNLVRTLEGEYSTALRQAADDCKCNGNCKCPALW
jgi:hypothetical protein